MPNLPEQFVLFVGTTLKDKKLEDAMADHENRVKEATARMVELGHYPVPQQMLSVEGIITVIMTGNPIPSDLALPRRGPAPTVLGAG